MRLILWPRHSMGASERETDRVFLISSGSKSVTVLPSSTRPSLVVAPDRNTRASASDVLPVPWCPNRPTLRIASGGYVFMRGRFYYLVGKVLPRPCSVHPVNPPAG